MTYTSQGFILISGPGIDVNSHTGERAGKRLGGDADAVGQLCDVI
jgi:hypothetical protein